MQENDPGKIPLTPLREDLQLISGPKLDGGSPTWTIFDQVRNQFFRIGRLEFELLARWSRDRTREVSAEQLVESVNRETTIDVKTDEVLALQNFFAHSCLLAPGYISSRNILLSRMAKKTNILLLLVHNYLFFRIPLFKPERFLNATFPIVKMVCSKPFKYFMLFCSITGLIMISRQWQSFMHTFAYFFSVEGFFYYALALTLVKIFHEMGHAYTAKYYGVRVPTIGVAFIVLWPMLYSDTTESWKIKARKARMQIVLAGIQVELALALIATLLWSFSSEGPFKSVCFIVATATWITSLFLNLSPFMRFDGYYLLSDFLDVPNLQNRSFNLGKWYLRRLILGDTSPCPEIMPHNKKQLLILYAFGTWLYRLVVFTTIALVVYHMFFKVLGLALFAVEITWFIALPVLKELRVWIFSNQVGFSNRNLLASFTLLGILLGLFFLPWNSTIRLSGLILPIERQVIYPPFAAQIRKIHVANGQNVNKGDILFTLEDRQLSLEKKLTLQIIATLETQLQRQIADSAFLEPRQIILGKISAAMTELAGYKKQIHRLSITAPLTGTFVDMAAVHPGQWIYERQMLGRVINRDKAVITGYIKEEKLSTIDVGNKGLFYADNRNDKPFAGKITAIDPLNKRTLSEPYLASLFGGDIPVTRSANEKLISHASHYKITMTYPNQYKIPNQVVRGRLLLEGKPFSFFERLKRKVIAVVIRESGF